MNKSYSILVISLFFTNLTFSRELNCYDSIEMLNQESFSKIKDQESKKSSLNSIVKRAINSVNNNFTIVPHKRNYLMPFTYVKRVNKVHHNDLLSKSTNDKSMSKSEAKFQFSFKIPIVSKLMSEKLSIWFAYSQLSFWQVYSANISRPFRESNYEPEFIFLYQPKYKMKLFGMKNVQNSLHLNHESNGRAGAQSRSWNRIMASFVFEKDETVLIFKPWYRIPDKKDDNPGIEKYIGSGEINFFVKIGKEVAGLRILNNFKFSGNKTSFELSWSIPLGNKVKGVLQYYNGYSESLIDYDFRTQRIGLGILLTDWL